MSLQRMSGRRWDGLSASRPNVAAISPPRRNIIVGDYGTIANDVDIRTSDSHGLIDLRGRRLNPPGDAILGDHAWLARGATVMKGLTIGADSIVGASSILTRDVPPNSLAVGNPARVVKSGVTWILDLNDLADVDPDSVSLEAASGAAVLLEDKKAYEAL